jgi:23S rRNA (cytidine2498-2'-O)-methyltransferase
MPHPLPSAAAHGSMPASAAPATRGGFLLVTCQGGAEAALVARQESLLPAISRAAWRRGVVTFRLGDFDPQDDFWPDLVFARTVIRSVGQVTGATDADRARAALELVAHRAWDAIHVWHRDPKLAAESDPAAVRAALLEAFGLRADLPTVARPGDLVLDCLVDSATRAWIGWHRARLPASLHAGGLHPLELPLDKVSRAWLKLDEAIASFGLAVAPGERACELGCAPGGACQRLLEAGLDVVGIDPAAVDPRVAAHPRFEQWRMRARDVKLRGFRGFDWIVADMNIDPRSTMAALERVVTADGARPRGIIATLKLPDWSRAAELPSWLERFRGWGFEPQARQLSTGGREVCVVALCGVVSRATRRARPARGA